jgi:hypothetical protein
MKRTFLRALAAGFCLISVLFVSGVMGGLPRTPWHDSKNETTGSSFFLNQGWTKDSITGKVSARVPSLIELERQVLGNRQDAVVLSGETISNLSKESEGESTPSGKSANRALIEYITSVRSDIKYQTLCEFDGRQPKVLSSFDKQSLSKDLTSAFVERGRTPDKVLLKYYQGKLIKIQFFYGKEIISFETGQTKLPISLKEFLAQKPIRRKDPEEHFGQACKLTLPIWAVRLEFPFILNKM